MNNNERSIRARENWLKTYQDLGSITKASIKLGISRSTLYRWINRYNQEGKRGLSDKSRRLNGKVERTQQTDKSEFWWLIDLTDQSLDLNILAKEWEAFYNRKRPHSSLGGKTPWHKFKEAENRVPIQPEVTELFWESDE